MEVYINGKKTFEGTIDEYKAMKSIENIPHNHIMCNRCNDNIDYTAIGVALTKPVNNMVWCNINSEMFNRSMEKLRLQFEQENKIFTIVGYINKVMQEHYGAMPFMYFMQELEGFDKELVKVALKRAGVKYFASSTPEETIWAYL